MTTDSESPRKAEAESAFMIRLGARVYGPLDQRAVSRQFRRGEITAVHEVSSDGGRTWRSARDVAATLTQGADDSAAVLVDGVLDGGAWDAASEAAPPATPSRGTFGSMLERVTPAVVCGVAGALIALTVAMPVGRDGGRLVWWEDPTPIPILLGGATLLGIGIAERGHRAAPSRSRATLALVAGALALAASAVAAVMAQRAAGWTAVANAAIVAAVVAEWVGRPNLGWMVAAGLGGIAPVIAGALTSDMSLLLIALLSLVGAGCVIAAHTEAWPTRAIMLRSTGATAGAVAVIAASIDAYLAGNGHDRFLVLDGFRHLLIALCALFAAVVAMRERALTDTRPAVPAAPATVHSFGDQS